MKRNAGFIVTKEKMNKSCRPFLFIMYSWNRWTAFLSLSSLNKYIMAVHRIPGITLNIFCKLMNGTSVYRKEETVSFMGVPARISLGTGMRFHQLSMPVRSCHLSFRIFSWLKREDSLGRRVHPQKRSVSWVNSVLRQFLANGPQIQPQDTNPAIT